MSNHFHIKFGVERMDSIASFIRHLQGSNHTQGGPEILSCSPGMRNQNGEQEIGLFLYRK